MLALSIKVISYNVEGSDPPNDLTPLLGLNEEQLPDLFAIGIQGMKSDPLNIVIDAFRDDPWTNAINSVLSTRNFSKIATNRQGCTHLSIYMRELSSSIVSVKKDRIGFGKLSDNEGAVVITLGTPNEAILRFVNVHLRKNAMSEDFQRLQKYLKIADSNLNEEKCIFVLGDFGSCLADPELTDDEVKSLIESGNYEQLLLGDQLKVAQASQEAFMDFKEGGIKFAPSFDAGPGTRPAWRDRMLWKDNKEKDVVLDLYDGSHSIKSISNHEPVVALFFVMPGKNSCIFEKIYDWTKGEGGYFEFTVYSTFRISSGDVIAILPVGFRTLNESSVTISASAMIRNAVIFGNLWEGYFGASSLESLKSGEYVLVYVDDRKKVVCQSRKFKILEAQSVDYLWFNFFEEQMKKTKEDHKFEIKVNVPCCLDGIYFTLLGNVVNKKDLAIKKYFRDFNPVMTFEYVTSNGVMSESEACVTFAPDKFVEAHDRFVVKGDRSVQIWNLYSDHSISSLRELISAFTTFRKKSGQQQSIYAITFDKEISGLFVITFSIPKQLHDQYRGSEYINLSLTSMNQCSSFFIQNDLLSGFQEEYLSHFNTMRMYKKIVSSNPFQIQSFMNPQWMKCFCAFNLAETPPIIIAFYDGDDMYSNDQFSFNWSYSALIGLATLLQGILVAIDCNYFLPSENDIKLLAKLAFETKFRQLLGVSNESVVHIVGIGSGALLATEVLRAVNVHKYGIVNDLVIIDPTCACAPIADLGADVEVHMALMERQEKENDAKAHMSNLLSLKFALGILRSGEGRCIYVFTSKDEETIEDNRLKFYGNAIHLCATCCLP